MKHLEDFLKKKNYLKIKLTKIASNHLELKARINGVEGSFILDTGASNSCIDFSLSEKFKLKVEDSDTKAAGAGAIDLETKTSSKNTVKINNWNYSNFNLVLLDLSHVNTALTEHHAEAVDGIIGADILEKGKAIIDYGSKCLFLKKLVYKF